MDFASLGPRVGGDLIWLLGLQKHMTDTSRLLNGRDKHILVFLVEQRKGLNENAGN